MRRRATNAENFIVPVDHLSDGQLEFFGWVKTDGDRPEGSRRFLKITGGAGIPVSRR